MINIQRDEHIELQKQAKKINTELDKWKNMFNSNDSNNESLKITNHSSQLNMYVYMLILFIIIYLIFKTYFNVDYNLFDYIVILTTLITSGYYIYNLLTYN